MANANRQTRSVRYTGRSKNLLELLVPGAVMASALFDNSTKVSALSASWLLLASVAEAGLEVFL
jgi:ribosomal protein L18E